MPVSRKEFLAANAAVGAQTAFGTPAVADAAPVRAPQLNFRPDDPNIVYDLVVRNGTVIDPAHRMHDARDVAVKNGQIAALLARGATAKATHTIDASGYS